MFPILSKIVWALIQPVSLAALLLILGLLLQLFRRRRTGWAAVLLGALVLIVPSFTTLGALLIRPLEARFERPAVEPVGIAGIIVLGGGMDADINTVRKGYELNRSGDRFVETLRLASRYPSAKVIMTGGGSVLSTDDEREADAAARFFADFGIAPERILLEDAAINTEENARLTRELLGPDADGTYLLVTSAFHMPRSVGLFRRAGLDVIAWPADYLAAGDEGIGVRLTQPAENLAISTIALREWIGLLAYWATGRIDELLPGPQ